MSRIVKCGLIQASNPLSIDEGTVEEVKQAMIDKHVKMIDEAGEKGVQILCLQELFYGPYFCAEQDRRWYSIAEKVPEGPTTKLMQELAKKHDMVIIVPVYEEDMTGVYYNTATVIDADGKYLGRYRKKHLPHLDPGFWEKFYFRPGNEGYPVFETKYGKVGVYICYDRHFPEGARELGLGDCARLLSTHSNSHSHHRNCNPGRCNSLSDSAVCFHLSHSPSFAWIWPHRAASCMAAVPSATASAPAEIALRASSTVLIFPPAIRNTP